MLYFSKTKLLTIYSIIVILGFFAFLNFFNFKDNIFLSKKVNLGLDLQGGSYLLLEVDSDPIVIQKLQNKLISIRKIFKENKIKYDEVKIENKKIFIKTSKNGIEDFLKIFLSKEKENLLNIYYDKYKAFELDHEINENIIKISYSKYGLIELKEFSLDQSIEIVRRRIDEVGTKEPTILKRGNSRILIELPGLDEPSRIKNLLGKTANLTFRFISENETSDFGSEILTSEDDNQKYNVGKRVVISGENLIDAQPKFDNINNQNVVAFTLDRVGSKRFGHATTNNVGKRLAIVLDNKIISAPEIQESILGGSGQITGNFDFQSATDLALLLRSGALPAPLNIIEERTVGPDLGEDSIRAGSISLIIGFFLVILFMFIKYKILGVIANLALITNLLLLLGILTLLEATLTLPGIAGIILTVGMAVDANVLIFERINEEKKTEKSLIHAFEIGYKRAQSAVFDANITTLLSAMILFSLGSGPVKGFAVTLGIGIITTLFSAYFFARHLSSIYILNKKNKEIYS